MTEYLIAVNDEWVPELTDDDLREASQRSRRGTCFRPVRYRPCRPIASMTAKHEGN
jgi:hypothetical protein